MNLFVSGNAGMASDGTEERNNRVPNYMSLNKGSFLLTCLANSLKPFSRANVRIFQIHKIKRYWDFCFKK